MNFKKATDDLFANVTHQELARELEASVAAIRQARLAEGALAHRTPPQGWKRAVLKLARARERHFRRLVEKLEAC